MAECATPRFQLPGVPPPLLDDDDSAAARIFPLAGADSDDEGAAGAVRRGAGGDVGDAVHARWRHRRGVYEHDVPLDVAAVIAAVILPESPRARALLRFEIAPSRRTEIFEGASWQLRFPRSSLRSPPRSRMGVRTALAAPLQASPFIIASIFALVRALLKERSWKLQERVVKDLAGAIPVVAPGTRVCIYGLSANPPTGEGGHATIVSHLRRMFDEVWVLPVYKHAFESKHNNMAPYEHRKAMCELAFGVAHLTAKQRRNEKVKVLDVERAVVRAAWDRHAVAEEEAKRQRADARGRARGGSPKKDASPGGMGSPTLDRANSGASSSLTAGADDSSAPSSPKTPKTPMTPTLASSSRLSPFKSPNGPAGAGNPAVPPPKVGSFDVLTAVREANPFASFSWCLGADTFADLRRGKWRNGAEFAALCTQLYVVPRLGGSDAAWVEIQEAATEDEEEIKALLGAGSSDDETPSMENDDSLLIRVENASVMEIPGMSQDVSSTAVRDALRRRGLSEKAGAFREDSDRQLSAGTDLLLDEATLATAVSEEVLQYATRHGLYA